MKVTPVLWTYGNPKTKRFSVKIRVCIDRSNSYYLTPVKLSKEEWGKYGPKRGDKLTTQIINELKILCRRAELYKLQNPQVTANDVVKYLKGESPNEPKKILFWEYAQEFCNKLVEERTRLTRLSNFRNFEEFKPGLLLNEIDFRLLKKYELTEMEKGNKNSTIHNKLKRLRSLLTYSVRNGDLDENPFDTYQLPRASKSASVVLEKDEFWKIYHANFSDNEAVVRDIFCFQMLCEGCRISDALMMENSFISENEINFIPGKTKNQGKTKKVYITKPLKKIIKRYKNKGLYLFPFLSSEFKGSPQTLDSKIATINKYLKHIAQKIDINKNLTTHVARHTFAALLARQGESITTIRDRLGHSSASMTDRYLRQINQDNNKIGLKKLFEE